jgi:small subunit ribosomal protein S5
MTETKEKEEKKVEEKAPIEQSAPVEAKDDKKDEQKTEASAPKADAKPADDKKGGFRRDDRGQRGQRGRGPRGRGRRGGGRFERQKPEFDQKIISIRRVTRVVAGGRRFAFSVSLVAGNRNGKVGVGIGKATDTALAIEKAAKSAKKAMVTIPRTKTKSIAHDVRARYTSSDIFMQPAPGKGIVAGSSVRVVLDLAGITDVSGKMFSRSKNQLNNARATIKALQDLPIESGVVHEEKKEKAPARDAKKPARRTTTKASAQKAEK